ncbi:MAG: thiolase family protein [bacterium]|nr:thiolase family protein [bacterium]
MQTPVVIAAARTPFGSYHGGLRHVPATELAAIVVGELLQRGGVAPADADEVVMGNVLGAGLGQNPARQAAALAGIPFSASALTLDMVCGSGLRSVCVAAQAVALGEQAVVAAGGMENMSRAPQILLRESRVHVPASSVKHDGLHCAFRGVPMGAFAEAFARARRIGRREQDAYALACHRLTAASADGGLFDGEIVPVPLPDGALTRDQCPRRDCTMEMLSALRPAFERGGTVTAGNATPLADGAAGVLVASEEFARERGIAPLARIRSWCTVGVEPENVFLASVAAVRKLLSRAGLSPDDIDLFEINESYAVQAIVCRRELGIDPRKVNVRGGSLSLGHPLGTSGAQILVTLLQILRDEGRRRGVAAICMGGGNGVAMLVERAEGGGAPVTPGPS